MPSSSERTRSEPPVRRASDASDDAPTRRPNALSLDALALDAPVLAQVVEQSRDAVVITEGAPLDAPGPGIVYVNAAFERMTGYTRAEVLGRTPRLLQGPGTDPAVLRELRAVLEAGEAWEGRTVNYRKDGTPYVVEWSMAPASRDADGTPCYWCAVQRDVTARAEAERERRAQREALQHERDLLARIFDASAAAITVLDTEGQIVRANARAEEVLGLNPSAVEGRTYDDPRWHHTTVEGDPFPDAEMPFVRVMATGAPVYDVRHAIEWPDGRRRILSINGAPLRDETTDVVGAVFVVEDITERERTARTLRRREARLEALYDATSDLAHATAPQALAETILDLLGDTLGYSVCAVRYVREGRLVPVAVSEACRALMGTRPDLSLDDDSMCTRAYRSGQTVHTDDVAVTGGMPRPGDVHALAIVPLGRFGVVKMGTAEPGGIDPFDVKLVELLAQHAASVLERIAREEALRAARDEAEEMNRLKSSFLANMSHEIRTPLTSVIGFSETLTDFDLDAPACDFAYLIHQSGTRLMHTLESVLSLSQLEAGTMRVHLEVLDAAEVVRAVAASFAVQADTRRLTLYLDLPEEPVPLICDRGALDRIVTNLVGNALKFTDADGRVEVRLADAPDAVTLAVADTGVGIDAAFLPRLFQAFQQESTGNAREYEGVGLGLTLTSHLVELVGGTIDVTSTKGEGTTFTVRFPRGGSV